MRKGKLVTTTHTWIDVESIDSRWMQVTDMNGLPAVKKGDLVRYTKRGYEVFRTLDAFAPIHVMPTRTMYVPKDLLQEGVEEE